MNPIPPRMQLYDLPNFLQVLLQANLITPSDAQQILRDRQQMERVIEGRYEVSAGRRGAIPLTKPADIVAQMRLQTSDQRLLDHDLLSQVLADQSGIPFEKPDPLRIDTDLISQSLSRPFAIRHSFLPLRRQGGALIVATDDPYDRNAFMMLSDYIGSEVRMVVSPKPDIQRIISDVYGFRSSIDAAQESFGQRSEINNLEQLVHLQSGRELEGNEQPIVNAVEYMLRYAFDQRASDIHIEPKRDTSLVRLRIDGVLHNVYTFPKTVHSALVSRLKMLARMDISEKRRPQDGRIKTAKQSREIELRVSSMPVAFGEKIVIRIFDPDSLVQRIEDVGFLSSELELWRSLIERPNGLILVTGPTGSGKTTTLYSTLKEVSGPDVNLTTVEDPIEMVYESFNQVLVQPKIGIDFASALRTILRQDPDVVMIGEIRDRETAQMAVQASLTGHLVFSTLHTNDAASSVVRMLDLGVEPFLLSSTLIGILAQRLVRKICKGCRTATSLDLAQIERLGLRSGEGGPTQLPVFYGAGCIDCRQTGYFGREGIFELVRISATIKELIDRRVSVEELRRQLRSEGVESLRSSAIRRLARGTTSYEEVISVTTTE